MSEDSVRQDKNSSSTPLTPLGEALELAERWKNIHTDESYGPQGKNLGLLARELLALYSIRDVPSAIAKKELPGGDLLMQGSDCFATRSVESLGTQADRAGAVPAPSTPPTIACNELADELERLHKKATPAPWAWDQRGEKINEWGMGVAARQDETLIAGRFDDEDAMYVEYVCSHEAATCNYGDPALIATLRNNLPEIIAALRASRPSASAIKDSEK